MNHAEAPAPGAREKLREQGVASLDLPDLLSILLGTGSQGQSVRQLASDLLEQYGGDLHALAMAPAEELTMLKGMGWAKASRISALFELARRREQKIGEQIVVIRSSQDVYRNMAPLLRDKAYEEFWILLLNRSNRILRRVKISEGSVSGTVADPKKIFKLALHARASALILLHNHPSGQLQPSQADQDLTQKILHAAQFLDMEVLDHLIFAGGGYFSFADRGMLCPS